MRCVDEMTVWKGVSVRIVYMGLAVDNYGWGVGMGLVV